MSSVSSRIKRSFVLLHPRICVVSLTLICKVPFLVFDSFLEIVRRNSLLLLDKVSNRPEVTQSSLMCVNLRVSILICDLLIPFNWMAFSFVHCFACSTWDITRVRMFFLWDVVVLSWKLLRFCVMSTLRSDYRIYDSLSSCFLFFSFWVRKDSGSTALPEGIIIRRCFRQISSC